MNVRTGAREFWIVLAILAGNIPMAVFLTIASSPVWLWFEEQFRIESYGHSGPAEWCYLFSYFLLVAICIFIRVHFISGKLPDDDQ